ncbi:hypothetical protein IW145_003138 [Coemansia sp. RSA 521]|nr:hypothetical protein IW145_003138 [Coemansia sp. RSA 521]
MVSYIPEPSVKQPIEAATRRYSVAPATAGQPGSVVKQPSYKRNGAVQGIRSRGHSRVPSIVRLDSKPNAVAKPPVDRSTSLSAPNGSNSARSATAANPGITVLTSGRSRTQSIDTAELDRLHSASRRTKPGSSHDKQKVEAPRVRFAERPKSAHQGMRSSEPNKQLWSSSDSARLAQECMRFWTSGQTVSYQQVARHLQRSVADVQMMLQLMLQEHVLSVHKTHWAGDNQEFVRTWAAIEFPKCPVLNPQRPVSRRGLMGLGGLNRCFSVLKCQRQNQNMSWVVNSLDSNTEPSVAIVSSTRSTTPEQPDPLPVATPAATNVPKKTVTIATSTESPLIEQTKLVDDTVERNTRDASTFAAEFTFQPPSSWPAVTNVFSVAPRKYSTTSSKGVNTMSKNSRVKRMQERRKQRTKPTNDNLVTAPNLNLQPPAAAEPIKALVSEPDPAASYQSDILGLVQAMQDVGDDEQEAELSPEQSKDTYDINRLDGDIDIHYFDITASSRKFIREFVESYVEKHFDIFYYRAVMPDIATRHCNPTQKGGNIKLADNALADIIEKELQQFECLHNLSGHETVRIDLNRADLHFHIRFASAVQKCMIFEGDLNWFSANMYATAVLNRMIEDVHYLAFEDIGRESRISVGSAGGYVQYVRTDTMVARMNEFKRVHYMGVVASQLTTRYVQSIGRDVFLERVGRMGYRPVPAALDYDDDLSEEALERASEHMWADVSIRGELHSLVMNMVPYTTTTTTMIMMQRAIEIYNKTIVSYFERLRNDLGNVFQGTVEPHGVGPRVLESITQSGGAVSVAQIGKVAQWLADLWFDRLQRGLLKALMADYQLRPVPLTAVRRWVTEDRAPNGRGVDFILNTRLYTYLKHLRVQMSASKWLYASAVATLRVIERAKATLARPHLLDHVSVPRLTELFRNLVSAELGLDRVDSGELLMELFVSPLDAESPCRNGDDAVSGEPIVDLDHSMEASRNRLEQLALAASSAPPVPHLTNPVSPKTASMSARLEHLELEVTHMRREIHGVSDMRHDVSAILALLSAQMAR